MANVFPCSTSRPEPHRCKNCTFQAEFKILLVQHSPICPSLETSYKIQGHECDVCGLKTFSELIFLKHECANHPYPTEYTKTIFKVDEDEWVKCPFCPVKAIYRTDLDSHIDVRHWEKFYKCPTCCFKSINEKTAIAHLLTHSQESGWLKCPHCPLSARYRYDLKEHVEIRHTGFRGSHACAHCEASYNYKEDLARHMKEEHTDFWLECQHCDFKTKRREKLRNHILSMHLLVDIVKKNDEIWYECKICKYRTLILSTLRKHQSRYHGTVGVKKDHRCGECEYIGPTRNDMRLHVLTHRNFGKTSEWSLKAPVDLQFECKKCDFRTTRQSTLTQHQRRFCQRKSEKR